MRNIRTKKSVIGPVISVFVMILVIAILSGLTFLFIANLKPAVITSSAKTTLTVTNETLLNVTEAGTRITTTGSLGFSSFNIITMQNRTGGSVINAGNYTYTSDGLVKFTGADTKWNNTAWNVTYSYAYVDGENDNAYLAVNGTESSGFTVVGYLPLIFLAVIFGAILTLVLRIILPYINLGQSMGGF